MYMFMSDMTERLSLHFTPQVSDAIHPDLSPLKTVQE